MNWCPFVPYSVHGTMSHVSLSHKQGCLSYLDLFNGLYDLLRGGLSSQYIIIM